MAKAKKTQKGKASRPAVQENLLPQNIHPMGERVEENKNIYIAQPVYKQIHRFTRNKTTNESGGVLVGHVLEELGKTNIMITGFIEAKYCEATPTTLKFTHETWDHIHKEMDKKYPRRKIVGWIHTHPDFGIFLSEYDKFIHENFFSEANQVAYVVDPIQQIEGFYFWINEKLEKCKGFYIYDKTGVPIDIEDTQKAAVPVKEKSGSAVKNVWLGILTAAVIILLFTVWSMSSEVDKLNQEVQTLQIQQENLVTSANQALISLQNQVAELQAEVADLQDALKPADEDSLTDPADSDTQDDTQMEDPATNE